MKTNLIILRHAEFDKSPDMNTYPGPCLNHTGRRQSEELATYLSSQTLTRVFTSDFKRCIETGVPLSALKRIGMEHVKALRERNPEQETHQSLNDRVKKWFVHEKNILLKTNTLIISHCGPINMMLEEIHDTELPLTYTYTDEYLCHTPKSGIWNFECNRGKILTYQMITNPSSL
jgi:broad specificity phosphatase PhoE